MEINIAEVVAEVTAAFERYEKALLAAMTKTPQIIERPIVVHNGRAAVGRPPENVLAIL